MTVIENARARGYPVKVALIGVPADLGGAFALWGKPQQYAQFLSEKLVSLYKGRLLVVMPNGYGFSRRGKAAGEAAVLKGVAVTPGAAGLADSAVRAVARLAAASGHRITVPPKPKGSSTSADRVVIVIAAVALLALLALVRFARRIRRVAPRTEQ